MPCLPLNDARKLADHAGTGNCLRLIGVKRSVYFYAIWSIWSQLGFLYKLYWFLLSLAGLYTVFSASSIVRRLPVPTQPNESLERVLYVGLRPE